jgi:hypothetical protein
LSLPPNVPNGVRTADRKTTLPASDLGLIAGFVR